MKDLGLDSLDQVEIIMAMEDDSAAPASPSLPFPPFAAGEPSRVASCESQLSQAREGHGCVCFPAAPRGSIGRQDLEACPKLFFSLFVKLPILLPDVVPQDFPCSSKAPMMFCAVLTIMSFYPWLASRLGNSLGSTRVSAQEGASKYRLARASDFFCKNRVHAAFSFVPEDLGCATRHPVAWWGCQALPLLSAQENKTDGSPPLHSQEGKSKYRIDIHQEKGYKLRNASSSLPPHQNGGAVGPDWMELTSLPSPRLWNWPCTLQGGCWAEGWSLQAEIVVPGTKSFPGFEIPDAAAEKLMTSQVGVSGPHFAFLLCGKVCKKGLKCGAGPIVGALCVVGGWEREFGLGAKPLLASLLGQSVRRDSCSEWSSSSSRGRKAKRLGLLNLFSS
ncbi:Acyl carrier protein, mitochondrial, partial [Ophiophagus hannah]